MPQLPCQVRQAINTKAYHADGATTWITNYCQDYGLFVSRVICKIDDLRLDYLGILTINVDLNAMIDSILYDNYYNDACYLLYDQHQLIYQSSNLNPSALSTSIPVCTLAALIDAVKISNILKLIDAVKISNILKNNPLIVFMIVLVFFC